MFWDFGDGRADSKDPATFDPAAVVPDVVTHNYDLPGGTFDVRMVTRQFEFTPKAVKQEIDVLREIGRPAALITNYTLTKEDRAKLLAKGYIQPVLTGLTVKLFVAPRYCGQVKLNTIPVRAFTGGDNPLVSPFEEKTSCWLIPTSEVGAGPPKTIDPDKTVFSVVPGATVSLNGISVIPQVPGSRSDSEALAGRIRIDPIRDVIEANPPLEPLRLTFFEPRVGPDFNADLGTTTQIDVPPPTHDPELGRKVSLLPYNADAKLGSQEVGGFRPTSTRIYLSPDHTATAKVAFDTKPTGDSPLNGATPTMVLGGVPGSTLPGGVAARSHASDDIVPRAGLDLGKLPPGHDFAIDLTGVGVGPFELEEGFGIAHYPNGGWKGGGSLAFDDLNATLSADYAEGKATKCSEVGNGNGPSGLRLAEDGSLVHVGAGLQFDPGEGPQFSGIELNCLAASLQTGDFFRLTGFGGMNFPPALDVITADVCFMVAILEDKDFTTTCSGTGADKTNYPDFVAACIQAQTYGCQEGGYTAGGDEVWISGRGRVFLLDEFKLGSAGFDFHAGDGLLNLSAFGRFGPYEFGEFRATGGVEGLIVIEPKHKRGFQFKGDIELALFGCPACVNVKALVSSKGIGACADVFVLSGGFVYRYGGDLDVFGGCGWDKFEAIMVSPKSLTAGDWITRQAPLNPVGGQSEYEVRIGREDTDVSLDLLGAGGAPLVDVVTPSGRTYEGPTQPGFDFVAQKKTLELAAEASTRNRSGVGFTVSPGIPATTRPDRRGPERDTPSYDDRPVADETDVMPPRDPHTMVTLHGLEPGTYALRAKPGSSITAVSRSERLPDTNVKANVENVGDKDVQLTFGVTPIPGQTVEFYEESADPGSRTRSGAKTVARLLKTVNPADSETDMVKGEVALRTEKLGFGAPGKRRIYATILQDGVPVDQIDLPNASYKATPPPVVPKPQDVTAKRNGRKLTTCWDPVQDATSYDVRVKALDRRLILRTVAATKRGRPCLHLQGFDASTSADVTVRAIAPWGESDATGQDKVPVHRTPTVFRG